ncbi:MAG TPA: type III-A CRISPR-associated protein Cas10/Csm1, partial [Leptolyngbya sp.]|nr:type III-A CRISPR-associated protein Cas10/Csm1 [Leptolyngbya sp.]
IEWANGDLPDFDENDATKRAKELFNWEAAKIGTLRLLFDRVNLSKDQTQKHYLPISAIDDFDPTIPYPIPNPPAAIAEFKQQLLKLPLKQNWHNLSFLSIVLEKYGACLSFGVPDANQECDTALADLARITGAVAAALASDTEAQQLSLIAGHLSGIQDFIYTISSDGALKSLRARSFYLELVTEEVVQQLLAELKLPRTSIIYTGGGKFYILAHDRVAEQVKAKCQEINRWLRTEFQGKIFLASSTQSFATEKVATSAFIEVWESAIEAANQQKTLKFADQIDDILQRKSSYAPCKVCRRDDQRKLQPLNRREPDSVQACSTCARMFRLGGQIMDVHQIVRSRDRWLSPKRLRLKLDSGTIYYSFFSKDDSIPALTNQETSLLVNNWNCKDYEKSRTTLLLLGNYGARGSELEQDGKKGFMRANEFAQNAEGIKRVGYLRMDVDRLGQIFAKGLKNDYSLPKLAGLSRQMSYFFKVYLNSLAKNRETNFISQAKKYSFRYLTGKPRQRLMFIYAGGDDLFVSGSWNEVVEFAFDVYQAFRAYTGSHPDITLSGGISIETDKFPLYQAASEAGEAEDQAKGNGRDSLGLFGTAFKWENWLGQKIKFDDLDSTANPHLSGNKLPELCGVWDFVVNLRGQLSKDHAQSFVRNLLATAQLQEQHIKNKEEQIRDRKKQLLDHKEDLALKALEHDREEIRYYLHLPKIAYTLARLPSELRDREDFKLIRSSLLSPYNAPYFRAIATWIELLNRD